MEFNAKDIKGMVMESVRRVLIKEEITKDKLIYVVVTKELYNMMLGMDRTGVGNFNPIPVPRSIRNGGELPNKSGQYVCFVFYNGNLTDLVKSNYGYRDDKGGAISDVHDMGYLGNYSDDTNVPTDKINDTSEAHTLIYKIQGTKRMIERNGKRIPYEPTKGVDYFIIEKPLRKYTDDTEFGLDNGDGTNMMSKKCLLVSSKLVDVDSPFYVGNIIMETLSSLYKNVPPMRSKEHGMNLAGWLRGISASNADIMKATLMKKFNKGRLNADLSAILEPSNTASVINGSNRTMHYGDTNYSGDDFEKIGIYWKLGSSDFYVIQFFDNDEKLYSGILNRYNKIANESVYRKWAYGEVEKTTGSDRSLKGLSSLYSLYGHRPSNNVADVGQPPKLGIDYGVFNDVPDLMSWFNEFTEEGSPIRNKLLGIRPQRNVKNIPTYEEIMSMMVNEWINLSNTNQNLAAEFSVEKTPLNELLVASESEANRFFSGDDVRISAVVTSPKDGESIKIKQVELFMANALSKYKPEWDIENAQSQFERFSYSKYINGCLSEISSYYINQHRTFNFDLKTTIPKHVLRGDLWTKLFEAPRLKKMWNNLLTRYILTNFENKIMIGGMPIQHSSDDDETYDQEELSESRVSITLGDIKQMVTECANNILNGPQNSR